MQGGRLLCGKTACWPFLIVTSHGECEIIWTTRESLISCGFARLGSFYLNLFLFASGAYCQRAFRVTALVALYT